MNVYRISVENKDTAALLDAREKDLRALTGFNIRLLKNEMLNRTEIEAENDDVAKEISSIALEYLDKSEDFSATLEKKMGENEFELLETYNN